MLARSSPQLRVSKRHRLGTNNWSMPFVQRFNYPVRPASMLLLRINCDAGFNLNTHDALDVDERRGAEGKQTICRVPDSPFNCEL
jgi:hypothetical protein